MPSLWSLRSPYAAASASCSSRWRSISACAWRALSSRRARSSATARRRAVVRRCAAAGSSSTSARNRWTTSRAAFTSFARGARSCGTCLDSLPPEASCRRPPPVSRSAPAPLAIIPTIELDEARPAARPRLGPQVRQRMVVHRHPTTEQPQVGRTSDWHSRSNWPNTANSFQGSRKATAIQGSPDRSPAARSTTPWSAPPVQQRQVQPLDVFPHLTSSVISDDRRSMERLLELALTPFRRLQAPILPVCPSPSIPRRDLLPLSADQNFSQTTRGFFTPSPVARHVLPDRGRPARS